MSTMTVMTTFVVWLLQGVSVTLLAAAAIRLVPASLPALRHRLWWLTLSVVLALPLSAVWSDGSAMTGAPSLAGALTDDVTGTAVGGTMSFVDSTTRGWVMPAPPRWLLPLAASLWALLAALAMMRLVRELVVAIHLARSATPVPREYLERWRVFARVARRGRRASVATADIRGACAIGLFEPSIVIGRRLLDQLADKEAETIVLHEHAHLRRYDDWTQLLQRIVLALVGFHPAVRWICRRIDVEREAACDQVASRHSGSAITCARALAHAAEISGRRAGLTVGLAPGTSLDDGGLEGRVTRLLSEDTVRPWIASSVAVAEAAVILAAGTAVLQMRPVVDFHVSGVNGPPAASISSNGSPGGKRVAETPFDQHEAAGFEPESADAAAVEPSLQTDHRRVSSAASGPVKPDAPRLRNDPNGKLPDAGRLGARIASSRRVAVRGAEQAEHTANLAPPVSSVALTDAASAARVPPPALVPRALTPVDGLRIESANLESLIVSRWSHVSERGADVGRSAAAAAQAIGRFFQQPGGRLVHGSRR